MALEEGRLAHSQTARAQRTVQPTLVVAIARTMYMESESSLSWAHSLTPNIAISLICDLQDQGSHNIPYLKRPSVMITIFFVGIYEPSPQMRLGNLQNAMGWALLRLQPWTPPMLRLHSTTSSQVSWSIYFHFQHCVAYIKVIYQLTLRIKSLVLLPLF